MENDLTVLRIAQLRMLDILLEVDKICKKHEIKYWIACGTLLGAIRHKGFIPWDDDLDIELEYQDYIKLLKILKNELPKKYILHNFSTDKNFIYPYSKVRELDSIIIEQNNAGHNYKYKGLFVDIFPVENGKNMISRKISAFLQSILLYVGHRSNDKYNIKLLLLIFLRFIVFTMFKVFRFFNHGNIKNTSPTYGIAEFHSFGKKVIYPLGKVSFENCEFPCPNDCDQYLSIVYGKDYMTLPPEQDRICHAEKIRID